MIRNDDTNNIQNKKRKILLLYGRYNLFYNN